jgi:cytochrome o ubiquinol oxidase subunit 2
MNKKLKIILFGVLSIGIVVAGMLFMGEGNVAVMDPKGWVALKQRDLIVISTLLMLIVVIPVFILTFGIAWKYRASNKKAKYTPDWDFNVIAESAWWGIPFIIVIALSVVAWKSSYELDPFKPLESDVKPVKIQVIALQWKWLFIYPEYDIATVNFIQFPEKTPLNFEITADAPMNSFWIPQLGGQIYAMPGMKAKLHLIADEPGSFRGSSANLSGDGFAGMTFVAKASSQAEFEAWIASVKETTNRLTLKEYNKLIRPSENNAVAYYLLQEEDLCDRVVMKYMMPMPGMHSQEGELD